MAINFTPEEQAYALLAQGPGANFGRAEDRTGRNTALLQTLDNIRRTRQAMRENVADRLKDLSERTTPWDWASLGMSTGNSIYEAIESERAKREAEDLRNRLAAELGSPEAKRKVAKKDLGAPPSPSEVGINEGELFGGTPKLPETEGLEPYELSFENLQKMLGPEGRIPAQDELVDITDRALRNAEIGRLYVTGENLSPEEAARFEREDPAAWRGVVETMRSQGAPEKAEPTWTPTPQVPMTPSDAATEARKQAINGSRKKKRPTAVMPEIPATFNPPELGVFGEMPF